MKNRKVRQTTENEYFAWLEQSVLPGSRLQAAAHEFLEAERSSSAQDREDAAPFLSVVTRTQGKRPEMLRETLLCLTGQSDTDFELLLMGHNLSPEQKASVESMIAELPAEMRAKTRLIEVRGGTRTTPLNKGFEAARGEYISILDDDDIVLDNWVSVFHNLSRKKLGAVLHTYCIRQNWETLGGEHPNTPRAVGSPDDCYCVDFNLFKQLSMNYCPPVSLAFPAYAFHEWGIRFDETLTTTEDWDYLMRVAFLTGVVNAQEPTQIYRIWLNAENSATVHSKQEWADNYRKIVSRFVQTPIVMPANALHGVIDTQLLPSDDDCSQDSPALLYYDDGSDFSDEKSLTPCRLPEDQSGEFDFCFVPAADPEGEPVPLPPVDRIRFDPQPLGYLTVTDLLIRVEEPDGTSTDYSAAEVQSNGYIPDDTRIVYWRNDPQIIVPFKSPKQIARVLIRCTLSHIVTDTDMDEAISAARNESQLFFDNGGNGYSEETTFRRDVSYRDRQFDFCFVARDGGSAPHVSSLRFDPQYTGLLTVSDLLIRVEDENGRHADYTFPDLSSNGYRLPDRFVFLKNDPQIIIRFSSPKTVARVLIHCKVEKQISDEDLDVAFAIEKRTGAKKRSIPYRVARKIYHLFKKIFRRPAKKG